jgi:hypothetical protein
MYVGTKAQTGVTGGSVVASELDNANRFRRVVRTVNNQLDESSGFETRLGVGEDVVALSPSPTILGNRLLAFTANTVYAIVGFSAQIYDSIGTKSPHSVCRRGNYVYYVDSERVQRRVAARLQMLSRDKVQDQFEAIPDTMLARVQSCVSRDRLYTVWPTVNTWSSPSAVTSKAIVRYEVLGEYESVDVYNASAPQPVFFLTHSAGNAVIGITAAGVCYAYESGATDGGQAITMTMQPGTFTPARVKGADMWSKLTVLSNTVLCTDQNTTKFTFSRTPITTGSAVTSDVTLPGTGTLAWATDFPQSKGLMDVGIDIKFAVSANYPFEVKSWTVEMTGGSDGPVGFTG